MIGLKIFSALDRKLIRDLWSLRGQAIAIALVIAGGVSTHVVMSGNLASMAETRTAYYERYRFADVWAPVVRAPNTLIEDIREIEGVAAAETRIMAPVLFDVAGMDAPANGVAYSLPHGRTTLVNDIVLVRGALPDPTRPDQAVVLKSFADAHGLGVGDALPMTIRGRQDQLFISGLGQSPEYIYAAAPGTLIPDPRLFGVVWMDRDALEVAADLEGAFSEVVVRLMRGVEPRPVIAALDALLDPYGAPGAYAREDQYSDAFIESELNQLETMGAILPPIFLAVAAFLVNIVISRLIAVEREQIGLLKAFGYSSADVVWHYMKLVGVIAIVGLAIGFGVGAWLGRQLAILYAGYFDFPFLVFAVRPSVYVIGAAVTAVALGGGAAWAVRRAARLSPAVAMRPPPPPDYSHAAGAAVTRLKALDQQTRMILRQLVRWPVRAALTIAGIAASGMLLITALYFFDAMDEMIDSYFIEGNRYDVMVSFTEARGASAYYDLIRREGVVASEPFRVVDARLQFETREERVGLMGVVEDPQMQRLVDENNRTVAPPPGGLVLSSDIATKLGVEPGDVIRAVVTEGARPVLELPVTATPSLLFGSGAQMRLEELNAALGEGHVISGALLRVEADQRDQLYDELKEAPAVAGVGLHAESHEYLIELMDQNLGVSIYIYAGFAGLIALGVIYNSVRISLAERQRELASLRVLGFSKTDVSYILLGEIAFLVLIAIPVGMVAGSGLAWWIAQEMTTDFFRLPYVISARSYGMCALILLVIAAASALIVRRRIDHLDIVAVLKTRE